MKSRLQRILSVLCILALLGGCLALTAFAEEDPVSRAIVVEWVDEENYDALRPDSVTVKIAGEDVVLNADNSWTAEKTVAPGSEWTIPDVDGYKKETSGAEVVTVIYTHEIATTSHSATVVWNDNNDAAGLQPESVRISLLANGEVCAPAFEVKKGSDTASWKNLPVYKKGTKEAITYTVKPADVLDAYDAAVAGDEITYTLKTATLKLNVSVSGVPEGADVSGLKLTVTGPDKKMPVTKTLGEIGGTLDLGTVIPGTYVVQEENADSLVEGYVIDPANSQVGDAVYVKGGDNGVLTFKYAWKEPAEEEPNEDPLAEAGELSFEILGPDSRLPITVTYSQFKDGKYTLEDLVPGEYAVIERNPEGLVRAYNLASDSVTGMVLTVGKGEATAQLFNRYTPAPTPTPDAETVDIPVVKIWVDDNNKDGNRPASVTVNLYADGVHNDTMVVTATDNWTGTFTGKPRFNEDGTEINYTINEEPVTWYVASVNGYAITNTYQPEVTSISVVKVWNDAENAQNLRPTSIAVTLLPTNEVYILNEQNGWTAVASNLPTKLNGQDVTWAWSEQKTPGYTATLVKEGSVTTITNFMPATPTIPAGQKKPKVPGDTWAVFEEYETALGGQLLINHVGDCFD